MEEKVFFTNSKGDKLRGVFSSNAKDTSLPIVIIVHGFSSNKNSKNYPRLVKRLEKKNIASFRIDLYGHGESEGLLENVTISEAVDDILQAIEFIKKKGYRKIALVGSSFSGNASLIVAAKSRDLICLVLKSPVSDYQEKYDHDLSPEQIKKWERDGYIYKDDDGQKIKLNYSFYDDIPSSIGYDFASRITIPTLIIHGDADESVPIEQSIKTSKLIKNCKLVVVKGADHIYSKPEDSKQMLDRIVKFISSVLYIY